MNVLRGLSRWLLALAIGLVLAAWVSSATLQATLLNRETVKGWLANSGAYDNGIKPFTNIDSNQGVATKQDMQAAFEQTFTPQYLRTQTETALDATFDWIEGKKAAVTYSIPLKDKREEFRSNLVKIVTPRLAQLPACPTRVNPNSSNPTCIPQGMNAASFADQSLRLGDDSDFLNKPFTQDTLKESGIETPDMSYLPSVASTMRTAFIALPIAALIMGVGFVFLSESKLKGLGVIGRRVFFQGLLVVIGGGLLTFLGSNIDLSATAQAGDAQQAAMVTNIINPLVRTIAPSVGQAFLLYGGIVAITGAAAWAVSFFIRRKYTRITTFNPSPTPPQPPVAPAQPSSPAGTSAVQPVQPARTMPKPSVPPRVIQ